MNGDCQIYVLANLFSISFSVNPVLSIQYSDTQYNGGDVHNEVYNVFFHSNRATVGVIHYPNNP